MEYIYEEQEIENLGGTQLQQKAQEIKQRFDYRRSFFLTLRKSQSSESIESFPIIFSFTIYS